MRPLRFLTPLFATIAAMGLCPLAWSQDVAPGVLEVPGEFASIQQAIDNAGPLHGYEIRIAKGVYYESLSIATEVTLRGSGKVVIRGHPGVATLSAYCPVRLSDVHLVGGDEVPTVELMNRNGRTEFDEVIIQGGHPFAVSAIWSGAFSMGPTEGLGMSGCTVRDATAGLSLVSPADVWLDDTRFQDLERDAIQVSGARTVQLHKLRFKKIGGHAIQQSLTRDRASVTCSSFQDIGGAALSIDGNPVSQLQFSHNKGRRVGGVLWASRVDSALIEKNRVRTVGATAIELIDTSFATIRANKLNKLDGTALKTLLDLGVAPDGRMLIEKNSLKTVQETAIDVAGVATTVRKNKISRAGVGIRLASNGHMVDANKVESSVGSGIEVFGTWNLISRNRVRMSGEHGIRVLSAGNVIRKNRVSKSEGFDLSDKSTGPDENTYSGNRFKSIDPDGRSP